MQLKKFSWWFYHFLGPNNGISLGEWGANPIFGPKIMILKKLTLSVVFYVMHALDFVSKLRKNAFPARLTSAT